MYQILESGDAGERWQMGFRSPSHGDNITWSNLDAIYNYAKNLGLLYKHHTLVWGSQQPAWVSALYPDTAAVEQRSRIGSVRVGQQFQDEFRRVVNEPIHAPPFLSCSAWGERINRMGLGHTAFQLARSNLPHAKPRERIQYPRQHTNSKHLSDDHQPPKKTAA